MPFRQTFPFGNILDIAVPKDTAVGLSFRHGMAFKPNFAFGGMMVTELTKPRLQDTRGFGGRTHPHRADRPGTPAAGAQRGARILGRRGRSAGAEPDDRCSAGARSAQPTALSRQPLRSGPPGTYLRAPSGQYPVPESAAVLSWLACKLDTGRTHQIRVHLESIGHPLVGDPVYRRRLPLELLDRFAPARALRHQALHACRLTLVHPVSGQTLSWSRPPPDDLRQLLQALGARAAQLRPPAAGYFPDGAAAGAVTHRTADDSAPGGDDD